VVTTLDTDHRVVKRHQDGNSAPTHPRLDRQRTGRNGCVVRK
jgi:hypothetical protein